mmetsp:Transcript_4523/g.9949  ORF Transcript_4523/g.9949 Transcript_4523/m.9949 type:complete len:237 (-) Transcript_4523:770-1480(-)
MGGTGTSRGTQTSPREPSEPSRTVGTSTRASIRGRARSRVTTTGAPMPRPTASKVRGRSGMRCKGRGSSRRASTHRSSSSSSWVCRDCRICRRSTRSVIKVGTRRPRPSTTPTRVRRLTCVCRPPRVCMDSSMGSRCTGSSTSSSSIVSSIVSSVVSSIVSSIASSISSISSIRTIHINSSVNSSVGIRAVGGTIGASGGVCLSLVFLQHGGGGLGLGEKLLEQRTDGLQLCGDLC